MKKKAIFPFLNEKQNSFNQARWIDRNPFFTNNYNLQQYWMKLCCLQCTVNSFTFSSSIACYLVRLDCQFFRVLSKYFFEKDGSTPIYAYAHPRTVSEQLWYENGLGGDTSYWSTVKILLLANKAIIKISPIRRVATLPCENLRTVNYRSEN